MNLKNWLKSCKYPENVINRAFRNARLQGQAPLKTNPNNIPFVTTYHDNVNNNEKVEKIRRKFNDIQSDHLNNVLKNGNIILAQKQPKNLLRLLSKARFNTDTNNFIQLKYYHLFYESDFHKKDHDNINCPEYLKKHLNTLS